jgi:hypothetical protein
MGLFQQTHSHLFLKEIRGMVESDIAEFLSRAYNQDIGQRGMKFRTLSILRSSRARTHEDCRNR